MDWIARKWLGQNEAIGRNDDNCDDDTHPTQPTTQALRSRPYPRTARAQLPVVATYIILTCTCSFSTASKKSSRCVETSSARRALGEYIIDRSRRSGRPAAHKGAARSSSFWNPSALFNKSSRRRPIPKPVCCQGVDLKGSKGQSRCDCDRGPAFRASVAAWANGGGADA